MTSIADLFQNPKKLQKYLDLLKRLETAVDSLDRINTTYPQPYSDTAGVSYSKADTQLVMDQLTAVTASNRVLVEGFRLVLSELKNKK